MRLCPVQSPDTSALTSGKITYTEKVKLQIRIDGDASALGNTLPQEKSTEKVLLFSESATLYMDGKTQDEEMPDDNDGPVKVRMIISGDNKTFTDLSRKVIIDQRDFMNRLFLIEKPLPAQGWKMTGNRKDILGYHCLEAESTDTAGIRTVAWFTPQISISGGPASYCNLPGMVLEVNVNNGERTITAKSVGRISPADLKIEKPVAGKKMTDDEFRKIVADKMKEMGMEDGGDSGSGAHVKIVIRK